MDKQKTFEESVLFELLQLATTNDKLIKKHILERNVFEITKCCSWNYTNIAKKTSVQYDATGITSNQFTALKKKYNLWDKSEYEDNYPENLKIVFGDLPDLHLSYKPTHTKTETKEYYDFRPTWFSRTRPVEVTKTFWEFTQLYEISHGEIKTTIPKEKADSIIKELSELISQSERKTHLDKAISRIHAFKGKIK